MQTRGALLAIITLTFLVGCMPLAEPYYRLEPERPKRFGTSCNGNVGPLAVTYFPFNGIFLSAYIPSYGNSVLLGFHVPEGRKVQLLAKELTISYHLDKGSETMRVPLQPAALRGGNPEPHEFRVTPDPYDKEDYFSVLVGSTAKRRLLFGAEVVGHKTYRFEGDFHRDKARAGELVFPTMTIDDKVFSGPRVPFHRDAHFGIYPLNC